jgi:hypothetical protein
MKKTLCSVILFSLSFTLKAQDQTIVKSEKRNKDSIKVFNLVVGGNYTYVWDTETLNGVDYETNYNEHTFSINLATDISKRFRIGVDYKKLYTRGRLSGKNDYNLLGIFQQYKMFNNNKGFGFLELGFYKGNYCTCGGDIPYKQMGISYLNWGAGYNRKLKKNLSIDLAFTTAQVISKIAGRYGFTQYIIGLDYNLDIIRKKR